jgi:chromosome segregation ATPase
VPTVSDILERLNSGLSILDGKLHTLQKAEDMAVALALRDTLSETRDEIERLRAGLAQYESVIIPSWKREEADWTAENERLRAELEAAESDGEGMRQVRLTLYAERDRLRELLREAQTWINLLEDDGVRLDERIDAELGGVATGQPTAAQEWYKCDEPGCDEMHLRPKA